MSSLAYLFIVTVMASVLIALLLVYFASQSSKPPEKPEKKTYPAADSLYVDKDIKKSLYNEISEVVDSREKSKEIADAVSALFNRELQKGIESTRAELTTTYEGKLKEKTESEELAWKKYQRTSADKKKTEAVIRSITEGLVVVNAEGKVIMMNPAAEKLLDVSKEKKIGRDLLENMKDEQMFSLAKDGTNSELKEIELVSKHDDTKKVLRASSAVIEDENGQTVGMVSVLNDITKQKEIDRLKETFVANVSHELRTPLVAVDKTIALILDKAAGEVTKQAEELLNIASRNIKRLKMLIDELLDITKLEAGKVTVKCSPTSLARVINDTVDGLVIWAQSKSLKISKSVDPTIPEMNIDGDRITQVLTNLIGNAVKFTPKGGEISVSAVADRAKNEVRVSVADNGIGISKENLDKIFDKFFQAGERTASDIGGTGIGLSIAKEMVKLHGGRIWVESEKGMGTKFTFTLPVK